MEQPIADRLLDFFTRRCKEETTGIYEVDGTPVEGTALHPVGLLATNAQAALAARSAEADSWVRRLWETPLRTGPRRYYDNCLYLFALLALGGQYRIWMPRGGAQ